MWEYMGKVINVVDGDTIDIQFDLGFKIYHTQRVRLARINTPEKGQPGFTEATNFVMKLVKDQPVIARTEKADKYGRYIAEIIIRDGSNLSELILQEGLATPYTGG